MTYNNTLTCCKDCRKYTSIFLRENSISKRYNHTCMLPFIYRVAFLTPLPVFNSIVSIGVNYFARNAPSCAISIFRSTPRTLSRFSSQQRSADRYAPLHKEIHAAISLSSPLFPFLFPRERTYLHVRLSRDSDDDSSRPTAIPPGTVAVHALSSISYQPVVNGLN